MFPTVAVTLTEPPPGGVVVWRVAWMSGALLSLRKLLQPWVWVWLSLQRFAVAVACR